MRPVTRVATSRSRSSAERVKAAVFHGPRDVRIEDVPDPAAPAADEVVLRVIRAAICGTDSSEWDHGPILCRPGVVLGHEFVGRVVEAASRRAVEGRVVAVDIEADRLATASALGANETVDATGRDLSDLLLERSGGVGFDIVIEASGAPTAPSAAIAGARRGGRVLLAGLHY